jgi:hypothetical protein
MMQTVPDHKHTFSICQFTRRNEVLSILKNVAICGTRFQWVLNMNKNSSIRGGYINCKIHRTLIYAAIKRSFRLKSLPVLKSGGRC